MVVLVTGGAGFIGSHLSDRLLADGHRVRVLDNLSSGKRANLPSHRDLEFIEGDIRDPGGATRAVAGVDAVFHLAAVASVQASAEDPGGTHGSNFVGTLNLLEAARHGRVRRFLYASSAAVYGDTDELPVSEETRLHPLSPYAADKLAGEHYLQFYARKYDLAATAFRFFNIYGPRQDPSSPYSGVISIFVDRTRRAEAVTIYGDGRQTRDFVYVGDLVDILVRSIGNERTHGTVFNVGRGTECSLLDLLSELERLVGRPVARQHAPARVGDIVRSCADVARLRAAVGEIAPTSLGAGLAALLAYHRHRVSVG